MVGFTPRANVFLVVSQPRRFVAQNDREIEGLGCLLGICPEFAPNLPGICGLRSEFARNSLRKRLGPAMRGTLHPSVLTPGDIAQLKLQHFTIADTNITYPPKNGRELIWVMRG